MLKYATSTLGPGAPEPDSSNARGSTTFAINAGAVVRIPLVTEIQRFSLQDGPGIRTTIFLKGCPLHCPWCHNPETQDARQEFYYYPARCVGCGRCVAVCPAGTSRLVHHSDGRTRIELDRTNCQRCMRCVAACLTEARSIVGQRMSVEDILREALSDSAFYRNSGGGVTISGGEPLYFPEFTRQLAGELHAAGVHVAIETSCFPKNSETVESVLDVVDLFIVDLKSLDPRKHLEVIGWPLAPILANLETLFAAGANVRIHIPLIPGFNDSPADFDAYVDYLGSRAESITGVDLLNFHSYGEGKYAFLGRSDSYQYSGVEEPPAEKTVPLARALKTKGLAVTVGGIVGIADSKSELTEGDILEVHQ